MRFMWENMACQLMKFHYCSLKMSHNLVSWICHMFITWNLTSLLAMGCYSFSNLPANQDIVVPLGILHHTLIYKLPTIMTFYGLHIYLYAQLELGIQKKSALSDCKIWPLLFDVMSLSTVNTSRKGLALPLYPMITETCWQSCLIYTSEEQNNYIVSCYFLQSTLVGLPLSWWLEISMLQDWFWTQKTFSICSLLTSNDSYMD